MTDATKRKLSVAHRLQAARGLTPETNAAIRRKISLTMKKLRAGRPMFYVTCLTCRKEFPIQQHRSGIAKYCSRVCHAKGMLRPKLTVGRCLKCGQALFGRRSKKFCNYKCWLARGPGWFGGMLVKVCTFCKKEFNIKRWEYERKKHRGYLFCSQSCSFARQLHHRRPNSCERILARILEPFGFRYVGNARLRIGTKFPDYVDAGNKLLIELFGERWHKKVEEKPRIAYFRKRGFPCLVIWARELSSPDKIITKIENFIEEWG